MPRLSGTLHHEFASMVLNLDHTGQKLESALSSGDLSNKDVIQGYAGLYLDLFTEFEGLIEKLFLGILSGTMYSKNSDVLRRVKITPSKEVETVLLSGKSYIDWLPYSDKTIPRAKIYFQDGKPFTFLDNSEKDKLSNYHKIRNAIAHKGKKAMNEFLSVISNSTLLPHEQEPRGFLRNIPNPSTGKTQLQLIGDELDRIAYKICN